MRRLVALPILLALLGVSAATARAAVPPVKHVWVIVLENKDAAKTFAADSPAPYLARELPKQGLYMPNYYGIGHVSLDNYVAMLSGQAPNPQTQSDCQLYNEFLPGTIGADGQALGTGCVYPATVKTLADQLAAKGLSWKGYMEDMGADAARDGGTTCAHPALNMPDKSQTASAKDQYATRHNPFVYFHSIIDTAACAANDVPLDRLDADLSSAATTPSFSFIVPDLCHDAHDATCADGGPGGLGAADGFLKTWVPKITSSPAFRDGLLMVTFDEAEDDSSACCGEPTGPNTPRPGGTGPGGGKIGAVLLSPYITPGTATTQAYNHYSLLRSLEDLFSVNHLGYAAMDGLRPFGDDVLHATPVDAGTGAPGAGGSGSPAPGPGSGPAPGPGPAPASGSGMGSQSGPDPAPGAAPAPGPGSAPAGASPSAPQKPTGCRSSSVAGSPRHLKAGTVLRSLRARSIAGRRVIALRAAHDARLSVSVGRHHVVRHLRHCRSYRIVLPRRSRGTIRLVASVGRRVERRTLPAEPTPPSSS